MVNEAVGPLAIAVMGPTASGKTRLAVRLAQVLNGEIISVDSALVYRGLNIGAAKPTVQEQEGITHHLIDIRDPSQPYSAADFAKDARFVFEDLLARNKTPILAGGTMLYFRSLLQGLSSMPPSDARIRAEIEKRAAACGWPSIHDELAQVDPESAAKIHPNHSQRLSRALEVWHISGKPMSEWQTGFHGGLEHRCSWLQFALVSQDRNALHASIAKRFELMLEQGLVSEVEALRNRGDLHKDLPAMRSVGYRQAWEYLDGDIDFSEMKERALAATRQLAKRQLTWLRSWPNLIWLANQTNSGANRDLKEIVQECLSFCEKRTI